MGYCVSITESTVSFDKDKIGVLMESVKKDFKEGNIKDTRFIVVKYILNARMPENFFYELRLTIKEDSDRYYIDFFNGEKLGGYELDLYKSMAKFTNDGYIEYLGEDGEKWRYVFKDGKCEEVYPKLIWD